MWTGIELLFVLQDLRLAMPDIVTKFNLWISAPEVQYFIPVLLMALLLWCFGKKEAELVMFNFGFSNIIGYLIKNIVKQPRPWDLDPGIQPDAESKKGAPGYSLPSGHTTSAVSAFGTMSWLCRNNVFSVLFIALCILIPFARMYLSVHTPLDITVGIVVVFAVCYVNYKVLNWSYQNDRNRTIVLLGYFALGLIISLACDYFAGKFMSNKMSGFCTVMPLCLLIKDRYLDYEIPSIPLKDRIIRAIPGLIISMVIMEAVYRLYTSHGAILGLSVAMVFIILVYPLILKKWDKMAISPQQST